MVARQARKVNVAASSEGNQVWGLAGALQRMARWLEQSIGDLDLGDSY
jgi:hypothetical protein